MKKLIAAALALFCASAIMVQAQDTTQTKPTKKKLTTEQQTLQKEILSKYDTNKDGKLDKTEKAAMSKEDKDAYAKAFPARTKKKPADAPVAPTTK